MDLGFGKVVTKQGKVIYLKDGEFSHNYVDVVSNHGLQFRIPIDGLESVNCVQRIFKTKDGSNFCKLFVYNV